MIVENTITVGNIITIAVFLLGGVGMLFGGYIAYVKFSAMIDMRVGSLEKSMATTQTDLKGLTEVLRAQAVQEEKNTNMQSQLTSLWGAVENLRKGEGLILPMPDWARTLMDRKDK